MASVLRSPASLAAYIAVVALATPTPARAQQVDEASTSAARDLGYEGIDAFQRGDFAVAADKLDRAYRVVKAPTLGLWSARAFVKQNKLVEASARFLEVTRLEVTSEAAVQKQAVVEASQEREALLGQIPAAIVEVSGAASNDVKVAVDGVAISTALIGVKRPLNPGAHHFTASLGGETVQADATFAVGETKTVTLSFAAGANGAGATAAGVASAEPAATLPPAGSADQAPGDDPGKRRRAISYVVMGAGGALVVVGAITGAIAAGKKTDLNPHCVNYKCDTKYHDEIDSYNTMRITSWVGFVGGGVGLAAGAVLFFTAPKAVTSNKAELTPFVTSNQVGVFGRF